jgi:hypothetical protein
MYEQFLVRKDSLENVVENGRITGFKFGVRIADYRGVFLSLHNGYYIKMDGIEYPRETQRIELNGKGPRSFEETKKCVWEHWNYDDEAIIYVVYIPWRFSNLFLIPTDICQCSRSGLRILLHRDRALVQAKQLSFANMS